MDKEKGKSKKEKGWCGHPARRTISLCQLPFSITTAPFPRNALLIPYFARFARFAREVAGEAGLAKIVAANWKMNLRRDSAAALARALAGDGRECWLFPAATLLTTVAQAIAGNGLKLGAQDVSPEADGAFTGDVSAEMLADAGCTLVLVGHSERRHGWDEGPDVLLRKLQRAVQAGLKPLYCMGETQAEREAGKAEKVLRDQLALLAKLAPIEREKLCAVAYEPVWAIGTGENATAEQAQQMHALARVELKRLGLTRLPVLYGGSVRPDNAAELLACPDVGGLLVGGASLELESLRAIDDCARGAKT